MDETADKTKVLVRDCLLPGLGSGTVKIKDML